MQAVLRVESIIKNEESAMRKVAMIAGAVVLGVLFYTLSAKLAIYTPISPVPITGQTLVVFLLSALYGRRLSIATMGSYIGLGLMGAPIFTGASGLAIISTPNFGYLIGMGVAAIFMGEIGSRGTMKKRMSGCIMLTIATAVIYLCGMAWLGLFVGYGEKLFIIGVAPFIVGDIAKIFLAFILVTPLKKVMYYQEK